MIVVAGGMIRSGSTFSFNIVQELLSRRGHVRAHAVHHVEPSALLLPPDEHVIVKTHTPDPALLALILEGRVPCVCTIRKPEDAIASWLQTFAFPVEHGISMIKQWHAWHEQVRHLVLTIEYEQIESQPREAIVRIARYLDVHTDDESIDEWSRKYEKGSLKRRLDSLANDAEAIDIGFSFYEKDTFFHRRHISSEAPRRAEETLTPAQIEQIRSELGAA